MEQIVYQESLKTFINHCLVSKDIADYVRKGMYNAGYTYVAPNWETSWKNSLPAIARALQNSGIDDDVDVAVEYRLKHSMERLDFLVYGVDENNNKNMVIVELKQWSQVSSTTSHNRVHAMVAKGHFEDHFHPSYQALNYANYTMKTTIITTIIKIITLFIFSLLHIGLYGLFISEIINIFLVIYLNSIKLKKILKD